MGSCISKKRVNERAAGEYDIENAEQQNIEVLENAEFDNLPIEQLSEYGKINHTVRYQVNDRRSIVVNRQGEMYVEERGVIDESSGSYDDSDESEDSSLSYPSSPIHCPLDIQSAGSVISPMTPRLPMMVCGNE